MSNAVLQIFEELCSISHPTFHQEPMKQLLSEILSENQLNFKIDEAHNVLVEIPASSNCEQLECVCLQAHYDMVFVSQDDADKFTTPIKTKIEYGYLRAIGTSLGADNCAALASILSLFVKKLHGKEILNEYYYNEKHGPLELLFTADEEVSLVGAKNMSHKLKSKYLINTDCEDHHHIINGSAGAHVVTYENNINLYPIPQHYFNIILNFDKYFGGHTGFDLLKQRTNVSKLILKLLQQLPNCYVHKLQLGQAVNSMPFQGVLELLVSIEDLVQTQEIIIDTYNVFTKFTADKGHLRIQVEKHNIVQAVRASDLAFLNQLELEENFVDQEQKIPCLSSFITVINLSNNLLQITMMSRSQSEIGLKYIQRIVKILFKDFKVIYESVFPVWEGDTNLLQEATQRIYKDDCKIHAIHACYETSYLALGGVQCISVGPEIHNPHSINEEVEIKSWMQFTNDLKTILTTFWKLE